MELLTFRDLPDSECYEPTLEHWQPLVHKGHGTTWGLPDSERWLLGLLREWARELKLRGDWEAEASKLVNSQREQRNFENEDQDALVNKLATELGHSEAALVVARNDRDETAGQNATLRMQLGKARKKIGRLTEKVEKLEAK